MNKQTYLNAAEKWYKETGKKDSTYHKFMEMYENILKKENETRLRKELKNKYRALNNTHSHILEKLSITSWRCISKLASISLLNACKENDIDIVKFFIETGTDPNYSNRKQNSAILEAVRFNSYQVVEYLLERGAEPNTKCGFSLLEIAKRREYLPIQQLLINYGAL